MVFERCGGEVIWKTFEFVLILEIWDNAEIIEKYLKFYFLSQLENHRQFPNGKYSCKGVCYYHT